MYFRGLRNSEVTWLEALIFGGGPERAMVCPRSQSPLEAELELAPQTLPDHHASPSTMSLPSSLLRLVSLPLRLPSAPVGGALPCFRPVCYPTEADSFPCAPPTHTPTLLMGPGPEIPATLFLCQRVRLACIQIPNRQNANYTNLDNLFNLLNFLTEV